ncbi:unnamed protein product [Symbiodinium microadriaticum]|nr:unnamed protein product [Symbiodinium microadriaticum]
MDSEQAIGDVSCFEEKAMYYRHIWKSAGHSVFENLEKVSTNFSQEGLSYAQFCERYNSVDGKDHVGFTFVRHPIARFISGYAEIESRTRDGNPTYTDLATTLKEYPVGSPRRAAAFFREFLRTGVNRDGHVKPQLEFMIPNAGCSVPMGFIGKTESMEDDWIRMFGVHQCNLSSPFDQSLGLHPNDEQDKTAMETILGWTGTSTIEPVDSSYNNATPSAVVLSEASADVRAIVAALQENGSRYLRALCWLLLADFVSFRFDMPAACRSGLLHKSTFALLRAEPASSTRLLPHGALAAIALALCVVFVPSPPVRSVRSVRSAGSELGKFLIAAMAVARRLREIVMDTDDDDDDFEEPWPNEVIHRDLQADEEDAFEVGAGLLQVVEATRP